VTGLLTGWRRHRHTGRGLGIPRIGGRRGVGGGCWRDLGVLGRRWRRRRSWLLLRRRHTSRLARLVRFGHESSMVRNAVRKLRRC
jgi:hypothetical protein